MWVWGNFLELSRNNFHLQISESLVQFTAARVCFQTERKDNGSCLTIKENIITERIWNYKTLGLKTQRLESDGSLAITASAVPLWGFLRINLISFYSLQYVLIDYFRAKKGHKSFEIIAENVLNVHPAHPKLSLYYMSFSTSISAHSSLLPPWSSPMQPLPSQLSGCYHQCSKIFFLKLSALGLP